LNKSAVFYHFCPACFLQAFVAAITFLHANSAHAATVIITKTQMAFCFQCTSVNDFKSCVFGTSSASQFVLDGCALKKTVAKKPDNTQPNSNDNNTGAQDQNNNTNSDKGASDEGISANDVSNTIPSALEWRGASALDKEKCGALLPGSNYKCCFNSKNVPLYNAYFHWNETLKKCLCINGAGIAEFGVPGNENCQCQNNARLIDGKCQCPASTKRSDTGKNDWEFECVYDSDDARQCESRATSTSSITGTVYDQYSFWDNAQKLCLCRSGAGIPKSVAAVGGICACQHNASLQNGKCACMPNATKTTTGTNEWEFECLYKDTSGNLTPENHTALINNGQGPAMASGNYLEWRAFCKEADSGSGRDGSDACANKQFKNAVGFKGWTSYTGGTLTWSFYKTKETAERKLASAYDLGGKIRLVLQSIDKFAYGWWLLGYDSTSPTNICYDYDTMAGVMCRPYGSGLIWFDGKERKFILQQQQINPMAIDFGKIIYSEYPEGM
jgi:hypothetical protein